MGSVSMTQLDAQERAGIYCLLARILTTPPTDDTIWALYQMAAAFGVPHSDGLSLNDLSEEFTELFAAASPRYVAPYESLYRNRATPAGFHSRGTPESGTGTATALQVQRCYRSAGLLEDSEDPDHIGSELRFMAYLWWTEAGLGSSGVRRLTRLREDFRKNHLMRWIGELKKQVAQSDRLGYYHTAVQVVEAVIQDDR